MAPTPAPMSSSTTSRISRATSAARTASTRRRVVLSGPRRRYRRSARSAAVLSNCCSTPQHPLHDIALHVRQRRVSRYVQLHVVTVLEKEHWLNGTEPGRVDP